MKFIRKAGLSLRIIALLSLALLPLGAIAIHQGSRLSAEAQQRSSDALIALTEQAAFRERQVIERAIGAADALGSMLRLLKEDTDACQRYLSDYVDETPGYSFVGFQDLDGIIRCSSAGIIGDFSGSELFQDALRNPRPMVFADRAARVSQTSVLVIMHPAYHNDTLGGFVIMSVSHVSFEPKNDPNLARAPFILVTFNPQGMILTSENGVAQAKAKLPDGLDFAELARAPAQAFRGRSADGEEREYAVVPVVPGAVSALGSWGTKEPMLGAFAPLRSTTTIVGLMWLASIAVAFFSVHQLVVRGLRKLSDQVRAFADHRSLPDSNPRGAGELGHLQLAFAEMAESTIRDEAALEDAVHEKHVLLKEVHHRVKNNLQLISSIINMQLRKGASAETTTVVRRLQDRVAALAAIHRTLYQSEDIGIINVTQILRSIISQIANLGLSENSTVSVETDLEDVVLYPDQAVPLALLVSEAVTNALKYTQGDHAQINIRMRLQGTASARVEIANTVTLETPLDQHNNGLGTQLIEAFAMQLDGSLTRQIENGTYVLAVDFPVLAFDPEKHGGEPHDKSS